MAWSVGKGWMMFHKGRHNLESMRVLGGAGLYVRSLRLNNPALYCGICLMNCLHNLMFENVRLKRYHIPEKCMLPMLVGRLISTI